jgi:glycerate-2-kinase
MVLPAVRRQFRLAVCRAARGGRSQELALAFADEMAAMAQPPARWLILAGGTDGRDGPTDAAGAIIDSGSSFDQLAATRALADHNSYHYLAAHDQLLKVPPTGTNLGDLAIVIALP